jgi:hypothetical protein
MAEDPDDEAVSLAPESDHAQYALGQVLASAYGRWGARRPGPPNGG